MKSLILLMLPVLAVAYGASERDIVDEDTKDYFPPSSGASKLKINYDKENFKRAAYYKRDLDYYGNAQFKRSLVEYKRDVDHAAMHGPLNDGYRKYRNAPVARSISAKYPVYKRSVFQPQKRSNFQLAAYRKRRSAQLKRDVDYEPDDKRYRKRRNRPYGYYKRSVVEPQKRSIFDWGKRNVALYKRDDGSAYWDH